MKVLIFGGTGAMGTPLVKYLVDSGNSVFVTTRKARLSTGNIHYITGNAHDFEFVSRTCSRILHFDEGEMPDDVPVTMDTLPTLRELFSISESRPGRTEHRKSRFCSADC